MSTYTHHRLTTAVPHIARDAGWFVGASAVAFAIPYLGVSVLDMQHDLDHLVFFAITLALLATYVRVEQISVSELFSRHWRWSVGIGVALAAFLVFNVIHGSNATARPHGAYFFFELLWRGLGYGTIDALLLTAFPAVVAYRILRGRIAGVDGESATPRSRFRWSSSSRDLRLGIPQIRQDGLSGLKRATL